MRAAGSHPLRIFTACARALTLRVARFTVCCCCAASCASGNNQQLASAYIPDIVKFSVSVQEKQDAFSGIFLTYYKVPCSEAEFEALIADSCRIFGAAGKVDWAERDSARRSFEERLRATSDACSAFSNTAWQAFRDNELEQMRAVVLGAEAADRKARELMLSVAKSVGVPDGRRSELLPAFESIFLSLSRSLTTVAARRQQVQSELSALRRPVAIQREGEAVRLAAADFVEQEWPVLCGAAYFNMLRRAILALVR